MSTMKDIATRAHVSIATVSRVFRNNGYVDARTRKLVLSAAEELDYTPNCYNKRGRSIARSSSVGIIVPDLNNIFFQEIIHATDIVLRKHDIDLFICNSDEDSGREIRYLSAMQELNIGGIIIAPVSETVEYNQELIVRLTRARTPIVLLDREVAGVKLDGVFQENYKSSIAAVDLFVSNGHTHIATIAGPITSRPGVERLNGYLAALKKHNIAVRSEYILYGDFKVESAYQATRQLLRHHKSVTAIFCANNLMALGALRAISEAGLSVPDDIALISFGSLYRDELEGALPITVLKQPTVSMGRSCAEILLNRLNSDSRLKRSDSQRITVSADIVSEGSERYPTSRLRGPTRTQVG